MRAQRAAQLLVLQAGMYKTKSTTPTSIGDYSVNQGLVDLGAYYQAGTFVSALQAIIDTAGKEKTDSDKKINGLKGIDKKLKNIPSLDNGLGAAAPAGRSSAFPTTFVSASITSSSAPKP